MVRIEDWRAAKDFWEVASESMLRETVMSTIEPEVMDGGRRMEGNSIWGNLCQYLCSFDEGK